MATNDRTGVPMPSQVGSIEALASVLAGDLLPERGRFKEYVATRIRRGAAAGLIRVDEESGFAVAKDPYATPLPAGGVDGAAVMVLVRAHRERLARAGLLDLADATREEVEDLEFLLRGGRAQELALAAMGVSLEELGVLENFIAIAARSIVALAAEGRAPPSRKAEATKMLDAVAAIYEPVRGWERALEIVFEGPFHTLTHAKPRERVRAVLELLRVGATDVPDALRNPTPQAINRAAEVIRSFRVTHRKPGRTHLSPAGMARRFVAAFRPLLAQSMKRSKSERSRAKRQKPITA